jgi:DNA repair protein RadD
VILRDYQEQGVYSLFDYFAHKGGHPIVAMPTGTGKSVVIAEFIRRAYTEYPGTRIMMLTHVKELIEQNLKHLLKVWPTAPAGVYSAGLKKRQSHAPITLAGIASVYKKADLFGRVDLVLIDECHLVNNQDSTRYQQFLDALRLVNPKLKVIGLSATPYRLKHGMLTDPGGLFTDVCFDLTSREGFNWMVAQGWISPLVPKKTKTDLTEIVRNVRMQGGEYVLDELQQALDVDAITHAAIKEAISFASDRNHWLVFATGIQHAEHVAGALVDLGITATAIHSQLSNAERDDRIAGFKSGRFQVAVNNNVLTTGFDFPEIDCIVMLRPTASPGLWVQMLGRGTRPSPGKKNCLVLDFAGNTARLGPINDPVIPKQRKKGPPGIAPVRLCDACGCYSHASARFCENPDCGIEFPRSVKITATASTEELIAGQLPRVEKFRVQKVVYRVHQKTGRPDSMRVDYWCGVRRFTEYVTLDHPGYAGRQARMWWELRCPWGVPPNVAAGMKAINDLRVPTFIHVAIDEKYPDIRGYEFSES